MTKLPMGSEWTFDKIDLFNKEIHRIATEIFKIDHYPNQIEVITAEQMIDAYASVGLPVGYSHWSYGKEFIINMQNYKRGRMGLAYEIVINSNPCIAYLMEENTMAMQALVIAHASYGHNAFFKNNYLFKERTHADSIIDYLVFSQNYIKQQEEIRGIDVVEEFLDHCHALKDYGFDHYPRPSRLSKLRREQIVQTRIEDAQADVDEFWDTIAPKIKKDSSEDKYQFPKEPQENLLYFFEKYAPNLEDWQRELLRIVRKQQEYFYPQRQTQVGNEGFATFTHYNIINQMDKEGLVDESFMLELLNSHTTVIAQPGYDHQYYSGINVYALGFAMFQDIRRMCENPTDEDREWFPDLVGKDWIEETQKAAFNHRDETFIQQYLSPKVIRDLRLFAHVDDSSESYKTIVDIHNDDGYRNVRNMLAEQKNAFNLIPLIEVVGVDVRGDRRLTLQHTIRNKTQLKSSSVNDTLYHVRAIWDFDVELISVDGGEVVDSWQSPSNEPPTYISAGAGIASNWSYKREN